MSFPYPDQALVAVSGLKMAAAKASSALERGSAYDVHDGRGQVVHNSNVHFRALLRSEHEKYKEARKRCEKRSIAKGVYLSITTNGGRFLDANGKPKSELEAMKTIMKSLKDMPICPKLRPNREVLESLPVIHYVPQSNSFDDKGTTPHSPESSGIKSISAPSMTSKPVWPFKESLPRGKVDSATVATLMCSATSDKKLHLSCDLPTGRSWSQRCSFSMMSSFDASDFASLLDEEDQGNLPVPAETSSFPKLTDLPFRAERRCSFTGLLAQALDGQIFV
jgi:hypothetical protein